MQNIMKQKVTVWFIPERELVVVTDGAQVPDGVISANVEPGITRRRAVMRGLVREGEDFVIRTRSVSVPYIRTRSVSVPYARMIADEMGFDVVEEWLTPVDIRRWSR